ncbi:MAG: metallophosphoesterase family protein [Pseudomonadales bacterium]|nr:metallophosphoesterase family protein [Pseudomonadales bacterium]
MKLALYSDVHLEFGEWQPPADNADAIILAGDMGEPPQVMQWIKTHFDKPVIYVPGNHEYYDREYHQVNEFLTKEAKDHDIFILQNRSLELNGVRFLGTTLWSGFDLYQEEPDCREKYGKIAAEGLSDFKRITVGDTPMTPAAMTHLYETSLAWLTAELEKPTDGPTVVITHFLPSLKSCPDKYLQHPWVPYFIANCEHLIHEHQPNIWLHGHSHECVDYSIGNTRIVANQLGYAWERSDVFKNDLSIEIE